MHELLSRSAFVAALLLVANGDVEAQRPGGIMGTVTAAESGAPLAGARVSIASPARVATSDEKGEFILRDLPEGSYEVIVTAVGWQPMRSTVTVKDGQT